MSSFNITKLNLPKLPAGYSWSVGDYEGLHYENSGILREYGAEWRPAFGVSIHRQHKFLFFKWSDVVARSQSTVAQDILSIKKAAVKVLRTWETS